MVFNDKIYTEDQIIKQLTLIENHCRDGSVLDAGCHCVEGKHLYALEGYTDEGVSIVNDPKEKQFLQELGDLTRQLRKHMEASDWDIHKVLHEAGLNPGHRQYLPHGLTQNEKENKSLQKHLSNCIKQAEITCCGHHTSDYSHCTCNPAAVCRAKT